MAKKVLLVLVLVALLSGTVFAESKHNPGEMLIGINIGLAFTPDFFKITDSSLSRGNYAITYDLGASFDYYIFNWLSVNSGLFIHSGIYLLWDKPYPLEFAKNETFTDWVKTPVCLTLPLMFHVNIPVVDFLYLGAGVNLNLPVGSLIDSNIGIDTKGKFFLGIPIDFGFDFIKPAKRGGARFFFRVTPEIHSGGKPVLIGFIVQPYNFKIGRKAN